MKKLILLFTFVCLLFPHFCESSAVSPGSTFVVLDRKYVPLFVRDGAEFKYGYGPRGMTCYDLDTVLPPGTFMKILEVKDGWAVRVFCRVSEGVSFDGFVHSAFFPDSTFPMDGAAFESYPVRKIESLESICKILDSYIEREIPFGWGCNNLDEVAVGKLYAFRFSEDGDSESHPKYKCVGFDCSGLLHSISSWTLPHSTAQLYDLPWGKCLCELGGEASDGELENALAEMADTDFVVTKIGSHVIISLHGGFVEARDKYRGIMYTDAKHALERLKSIACKGKIRVIRWHPELL